MNWDRAEGQWKQVKGAVKERWGKLTDYDLNVIGGKKDQLVGRVQERYGIAKDEALKQVDEWNTEAPVGSEKDLGYGNRKAS